MKELIIPKCVSTQLTQHQLKELLKANGFDYSKLTIENYEYDKRMDAMICRQEERYGQISFNL
jgi:hypothetical protein